MDELRIWLPDEVPVHNFADPDALPYERIPWAPETRQRRLEGLVGLLTWEAMERRSRGAEEQSGQTTEYRIAYAYASPRTARPHRRRLRPRADADDAARPRDARWRCAQIRQGQAFDLNRMLAAWVGLGYEAAAVVEAPGQFSRRGGIVDVWPPNLRKPLRIELFGDEVDSLRTFDPSTQRTLARIEQAWIGPASEALPKLGERVGRPAARPGPLGLPSARRASSSNGKSSSSRRQRLPQPGMVPPLPLQPARQPDRLPAGAGAWLVIEDAAELLATLADLEGQAEQLARDLRAAGDVPAALAPPYFTADALRERLSARPALSWAHSTADCAGGRARRRDHRR